MMQEVTLEQILQARDLRAEMQQKLSSAHRVPLVCFTMNIAGPVKQTPLIEKAFFEGIRLLEAHLPAEKILHKHIRTVPTGCEAMYSVNEDAAALKSICVQIEEFSPMGRLFDMDVVDPSGKKLTRPAERCCLVCGAPGRACAARRLHTIQQLQATTAERITGYFKDFYQEKISDLAVSALIEEVNTTPKPGLVDRRNNGSHKDMDLNMFYASALALKSYFSECVAIGQNTAALAPDATFAQLRTAGIAAEKAMYRVTGGVNTHKGIIYSMGILCGALGRLWDALAEPTDTGAIFKQCAKMVSKAVTEDFAVKSADTAGLQLHKQYGLTGIRGEVAAGFPSIVNVSLPAYKNATAQGLSTQEAGRIALLHLIAHIKDTNLYHRGGTAGAAFAAESAKELLGSTPTEAQLEALDDAFIARNLSPGGCADLLAITYLITSL